MKDSTKAYIIILWGFAPFFLWVFLWLVLGLFPFGALSGDVALDFFVLIGTLVIAAILQFHPRVQHFNEARDAFEKEYKYEKEV